MNHDDRLTNLHSSTADDLDGLLDVEAGLREALVAAQHTNTGNDLDLDIETGLRAIIPAPKVASPSPATPPPTHTGQPSAAPDRPELHGAVATRLMSLNNASRLALRNHPAIAALALILEITNATAANQTLAEALADSDSDALALALDIARARARALANALERALADARDLANDLANDLARDLDHALADARDHALALANTRDLDLANTPGLVIALYLARDHSQDLADARNLANTRGLPNTRGRPNTRGFPNLRGLADARARQLARDLARARHDFTEADLSSVDLSGVSLTGIRWSMATKWPSDQWRDQALRDSRDLGDGTYEIQGGATNVPLHHT